MFRFVYIYFFQSTLPIKASEPSICIFKYLPPLAFIIFRSKSFIVRQLNLCPLINKITLFPNYFSTCGVPRVKFNCELSTCGSSTQNPYGLDTIHFKKLFQTTPFNTTSQLPTTLRCDIPP